MGKLFDLLDYFSSKNKEEVEVSKGPVNYKSVIEFLLLEKLDDREYAIAELNKSNALFCLKTIDEIKLILTKKYSNYNIYNCGERELNIFKQYFGSSKKYDRANCILSMHPNGYIRHEAICRIVLCDIDLIFPFLLLRLNDWVPKIAKQSKSIILSNIKSIKIAVVLNNLVTICELEKMKRVDHFFVIEALRARIENESKVEDLLVCLSIRNRYVNTFILNILFSMIDVDIINYISYFEKLNDPITLKYLYKLMMDSNKAFDKIIVQNLMLNSSISSIRKLGVDSLIDLKPIDYSKVTKLLSDKSSYVRMVAQFHSKKYYSADYIEEYYSNQLSKPQTTDSLIGTILGIGEMSFELFDLIEPFLKNSNNLVRAASLSTLSKLSIQKIKNQVFELLNDKSAKVSKVAYKILSNQSSFLIEDKLEALFSDLNLTSNKRRVLFLLEKLDRYKSIKFLLLIRTVLNTKELILQWEYIIFTKINCNSYLRPDFLIKESIFKSSSCLALLGLIDTKMKKKILMVLR